jgi:hypothetical protein
MIRLDLEDLLEEVAGQILTVFEVEAERLHIQAVGVCVETLEKQWVQMKSGHKYNLKHATDRNSHVRIKIYVANSQHRTYLHTEMSIVEQI